MAYFQVQTSRRRHAYECDGPSRPCGTMRGLSNKSALCRCSAARGSSAVSGIRTRVSANAGAANSEPHTKNPKAIVSSAVQQTPRLFNARFGLMRMQNPTQLGAWNRPVLHRRARNPWPRAWCWWRNIQRATGIQVLCEFLFVLGHPASPTITQFSPL